MYNQTIQNIKLFIIPLDGVIFDLNRYRYNYYKHYCYSKNVQLDKKEFYSHLSNMYDMYKGLPLSQNIDIGPFNARIERELFQYLHYKGLSPKEGLLELIEYAQQKNIKIAVLSTHRTKDAVEYLKLAKIYNKFHFIIGSDTASHPLPSTQMLETIRDYFQVSHEETLVISSFLSLSQAASTLHMNTIYCEDLVKASSKEKNISYRTVSNLFEVLNILLFERYEDMQIYSPILGMNDHMSKEEIDNVHQKLIETYHNDNEVLNVIEQTYQYHISLLNEDTGKPSNKKSIQNVKSKRLHRFSFDDEKEENISQNKITKKVESNEKKDSQESKSDASIMRSLDEKEEKELSLLLQQLKSKEKKETEISTDKEVIQDTKNPLIKNSHLESNDYHFSFVSLSINFLYILSISFFTLFIGIIFNIAFIHQFRADSGIFGIINLIFHNYYLMIESILKTIFNLLHSFISFVPSYEQYYQSTALFSIEGKQLLHIFIFNTIIIIIIKFIYSFIKRRYSQEDA